MSNRALITALVMGSLVSACSEHPTAPRTAKPNAPSMSRGQGAATAAAERAALLTNVPVSGTLASGGSFSGTLTATKITIDQTTRQLTMTGILNGTATTASGEVVNVVNQTFTAPVSLNEPGIPVGLVRPAAQASCGILNLVLGPLHLDLLGLVVDLNQVVLNVAAMTGAGNLLGNLLCALTGLLDIPGAIAAISHILDSINAILSGLTVPGVGGVMWIQPQQTLQSWSA